MKEEFYKHPVSPVDFLYLLRSKYDPDELEFECGKYVPPVPGMSERVTVKVAGDDLCDSWLSEMFDSLENHQELAWHCWVTKSEKRYFIPMIDFVGKHSEEKLREAIEPLLCWVDAPFFLFSSGQSFHGYFATLLPEKEWDYYLGSLLLLNPRPPNKVDLIDSRWVGHSLQNGLCALRWTNNTAQFTQKPEALSSSAKRTSAQAKARSRIARNNRGRTTTKKRKRRSPA